MRPKTMATTTTGGGLWSRTSIQSAIACIGAFVKRRCLITNGIRLGLSSTFETTTASTSLPGHNGENYNNTTNLTRVSALSGWDPSLSNTTGADHASKALHVTAVQRKRWATRTSVGSRMALPVAVPSKGTENILLSMSASHPIVTITIASVDDDNDASGRRMGTNERVGHTTRIPPRLAAWANFS